MDIRESERSRSQRSARSPTKQTETKQQRKERLKNTRAERTQLRLRLVEDDDAVLTFREWCALSGHSERQGRRISGSIPEPLGDVPDDNEFIADYVERSWQFGGRPLCRCDTPQHTSPPGADTRHHRTRRGM